MPRLLPALILALLPACAAAPLAAPPTTAPSPSAPPLPTARHGRPLPADPVPTISLTSGNVLLDGQIVGDVAPILRAGGLQRVDGLRTSLVHARDTWKTAHPAASFPGIDLLSFPPTTPAIVVKSVFQTAAFAGYPNEKLAVRATDGSTLCIDVDAIVPGRPGADGVQSETAELDVVVRATQFVLGWRKGGKFVSTLSIESLDNLPARIQSEWLAHGAHRDPSDRAFDQAVLFVDDAVDYGRIVAVVDAIQTPTRILASVGEVPALEVRLSMAKTAPSTDAQADGGHGINGRLAPEIIQKIVRAHFDTFRGCYEAALGRNATLAGIVRVRFVIDRTGTVSEARDEGSTLADQEAVQCVVRGFGKLTFPAPDGGTVTVVYPIQFKPGD